MSNLSLEFRVGARLQLIFQAAIGRSLALRDYEVAACAIARSN